MTALNGHSEHPPTSEDVRLIDGEPFVRLAVVTWMLRRTDRSKAADMLIHEFEGVAEAT